jgi:hypothetical protein
MHCKGPPKGPLWVGSRRSPEGGKRTVPAVGSSPCPIRGSPPSV